MAYIFCLITVNDSFASARKVNKRYVLIYISFEICKRKLEVLCRAIQKFRFKKVKLMRRNTSKLLAEIGVIYPFFNFSLHHFT